MSRTILTPLAPSKTFTRITAVARYAEEGNVGDASGWITWTGTKSFPLDTPLGDIWVWAYNCALSDITLCVDEGSGTKEQP